MDLIDYIFTDSNLCNVISIIGIAKNSGKTTTLNHLINHFVDDIKLGLTSIGRDGEKYDIITKLPKPQISIRKGVIFATAEKAIDKSSIKFELIEKTAFNTPMGLIIIGKALDDGYIELAGPSINHQLKELCENLKKLGCNIILIDGAFDRKAYATPLISDGVILSSGASYSDNINDVIEETIHIVNIFNISEEKNPRIRSIIEKNFKNMKVGLLNKSFQLTHIKVPTLLGLEKKVLENIDEDTKYLIINGALTDKLLGEIIKKRFRIKDLTILIEDPTKLLASSAILLDFLKTKNTIKVLNPIELLAITINPTSPFGYEFEPTEFMRKLKKRIDIPIFNLNKN
ncbi:MAG: hypothetical protein GF317_05605 [Candidatus Lokiarchaeota archaeon]|nr:hypothetical protein [Candidatus Lokiarchaeota archaeon]MBD3199283.1 hypothetical protein [Candidatus Lokiarchaeota archaeon]